MKPSVVSSTNLRHLYNVLQLDYETLKNTQQSNVVSGLDVLQSMLSVLAKVISGEFRSSDVRSVLSLPDLERNSGFHGLEGRQRARSQENLKPQPPKQRTRGKSFSWPLPCSKTTDSLHSLRNKLKDQAQSQTHEEPEKNNIPRFQKRKMEVTNDFIDKFQRREEEWTEWIDKSQQQQEQQQYQDHQQSQDELQQQLEQLLIQQETLQQQHQFRKSREEEEQDQQQQQQQPQKTFNRPSPPSIRPGSQAPLRPPPRRAVTNLQRSLPPQGVSLHQTFTQSHSQPSLQKPQTPPKPQRPQAFSPPESNNQVSPPRPSYATPFRGTRRARIFDAEILKTASEEKESYEGWSRGAGEPDESPGDDHLRNSRRLSDALVTMCADIEKQFIDLQDFVALNRDLANNNENHNSNSKRESDEYSFSPRKLDFEPVAISKSSPSPPTAPPPIVRPRNISKVVPLTTHELREKRATLLVSSVNWEKRNYIAREVLTTERNYLNDIKSIKMFEEKLISTAVIPPQLVHKIIPPVLSIIIEISENLLYQLEESMDSSTHLFTPTIGPIFLEISDFMPDAYTQYTNSYENSRSLLIQLQKENSAFSAVISACEKEKRCQGHTLEDLLISVIQRIPRYGLLLNDLLRSTPEIHEDYEPLSEALLKVKSVAEYINSQQKKFEGVERAKQIHMDLKIEAQWVPSRVFVGEFDVYRIPPPLSRADRKLLKETSKLFVFNDTLLIVRYKMLSQGKKIIGVVEKIKKLPLNAPFQVISKDNFKLSDKILFCVGTDMKKIVSMFEEIQKSDPDDKKVRLLRSSAWTLR